MPSSDPSRRLFVAVPIRFSQFRQLVPLSRYPREVLRDRTRGVRVRERVFRRYYPRSRKACHRRPYVPARGRRAEYARQAIRSVQEDVYREMAETTTELCFNYIRFRGDGDHSGWGFQNG